MTTKGICLCITGAILMNLFFSGCALQKDISVKNVSQENVHYQVAFERQILVNLNSSNNQDDPQKMTEHLDLVMGCQSLGGNADGSMAFKITFESVKAKKTDFIQTGRFTDSAAGLSGKSFTVTITSDGKVSSSQLEKALKDLSVNSFEEVKRPGARFKQADFLADIWAIQTLVFESAAGVGKASFKTSAQLPFPIADIPGPVIQTSWQTGKAVGDIVLKGKEQFNEGVTPNPMPQLYFGQYKMEGLLGYLRQCRYESIDGQILCRFDKDSQLPREINVERSIKASADYILTQSNPHCQITVKESLKMLSLR